jgi:hypothetical protein
MIKQPIAGMLVLVSSAAFLLTLQSPVSASPSPIRGSSPLGNWVGRWSGEVSETPAPPPGDPKNPYKIVISINKDKKGTVDYPAWKCNYNLAVTAVSATKLNFTETVVNVGPYNCVSQETVVMKATSTGATFTGTAGADVEKGPVSKIAT